MLPHGIPELLNVYRDGLLCDTLPFWIPRAIDRECGGYITSLDQDGTILHTDKPVWFQGRFAWILATLYNTVERRPEWLELARHGIDFITKHCFDADGRMFFSVTREGRPLRKRRYLFSECFAVIALAAYGIAADDASARQRALDLFKMVLKYHTTPGLVPPKTIPGTRPMKGLAMPMILTVTAQELRKAVDDPITREVIDRNHRLVEACRSVVAQHSLPANVVEFGAKGCVTWSPEPIRNYRDYKATDFDLAFAQWIHGINRGVLLPPGLDEQWLISVMHTDEAAMTYAGVFADFVEELVR